jgi:hypothetical protein
MVRGAAGLGKSRLCRELMDGASAGGALVTVGRAVPSGASAPYRPLAEAVLRAVRARGVPAGEPDLAPWLPALANKQIAERLTLSVRTVEKHMESLLRKTGCASRTQLVALVRS